MDLGLFLLVLLGPFDEGGHVVCNLSRHGHFLHHYWDLAAGVGLNSHLPVNAGIGRFGGRLFPDCLEGGVRASDFGGDLWAVWMRYWELNYQEGPVSSGTLGRSRVSDSGEGNLLVCFRERVAVGRQIQCQKHLNKVSVCRYHR